MLRHTTFHTLDYINLIHIIITFFRLCIKFLIMLQLKTSELSKMGMACIYPNACMYPHGFVNRFHLSIICYSPCNCKTGCSSWVAPPKIITYCLRHITTPLFFGTFIATQTISYRCLINKLASSLPSLFRYKLLLKCSGSFVI